MSSGATALSLWAFPVGVLLCSVYDCIRIARRVFRSGKIALFISDLLFCLISSAVFAVLFFNTVNGKVRLYPFFIAAAGFIFWRKTAGGWLTSLAIKLIDRFYRFIAARFLKARARLRYLSRTLSTVYYCRKNIKAAKSGFGYHKQKIIKRKKKYGQEKHQTQ